MKQPKSTRTILTASLTMAGALALVGTSFTGTAFATSGKASAPATITENNDSNDGGTPNNVVDAGDNAHPSGKDRSVEHGGSGNQGKASSDPDDDGRGQDRSNGGPDKPGGTGGVDAADQDRNNGCGNDDDFEDDNEGWCGRKPATPQSDSGPRSERGVKPEAKGDAKPASQPETMGGSKPGTVASASSTTPIAASSCGAGPMAGPCEPAFDAVGGPAFFPGQANGAVLGAEVEAPAVHARSSSPAKVATMGTAAAVAGSLPFTGIDSLLFAELALLAVAAGFAMVRMSRRTNS